MITGDKTTVDIDGAIALLGTEFTNNINEILTDVKAVLEKEEVTLSNLNFYSKDFALLS